MADAPALGAGTRKGVEVQVLSPAPRKAPAAPRGTANCIEEQKETVLALYVTSATTIQLSVFLSLPSTKLDF